MSWFTWMCFLIGLIIVCFVILVFLKHVSIVLSKTVSYHIWVIRVAKLNGQSDKLHWKLFPNSIWTRILDFNEDHISSVTHPSGSYWESTFKYTIQKKI